MIPHHLIPLKDNFLKKSVATLSNKVTVIRYLLSLITWRHHQKAMQKICWLPLCPKNQSWVFRVSWELKGFWCSHRNSTCIWMEITSLLRGRSLCSLTHCITFSQARKISARKETTIWVIWRRTSMERNTTSTPMMGLTLPTSPICWRRTSRQWLIFICPESYSTSPSQ